jgi:hypothetical protein
MLSVASIEMDQTARISLHRIKISKSWRPNNNSVRHFVSATSCPNPDYRRRVRPRCFPLVSSAPVEGYLRIDSGERKRKNRRT